MARDKSGMEKLEEGLLQRIRRGSDNVNSKSSAVAIAKSQGMMKQDGKKLSLTEKGRKAARKAKK